LTDSYLDEKRDKEDYERLEQELENMLMSNDDVFSILKRLDFNCNCKYSTEARMSTIKALTRLKKKYPGKEAKIKRLINHYAREDKDLVILKPGHA